MRGAPVRGASSEARAEPPRERAQRGEADGLGDHVERPLAVLDEPRHHLGPHGVDDRGEGLALPGQAPMDRPAIHSQLHGDQLQRAPARGQRLRDDLAHLVAHGDARAARERVDVLLDVARHGRVRARVRSLEITRQAHDAVELEPELDPHAEEPMMVPGVERRAVAEGDRLRCPGLAECARIVRNSMATTTS